MVLILYSCQKTEERIEKLMSERLLGALDPTQTYQQIFVLSKGLSASGGMISRRSRLIAISASAGITSVGLSTMVRG